MLAINFIDETIARQWEALGERKWRSTERVIPLERCVTKEALWPLSV